MDRLIPFEGPREQAAAEAESEEIEGERDAMRGSEWEAWRGKARRGEAVARQSPGKKESRTPLTDATRGRDEDGGHLFAEQRLQVRSAS